MSFVDTLYNKSLNFPVCKFVRVISDIISPKYRAHPISISKTELQTTFTRNLFFSLKDILQYTEYKKKILFVSVKNDALLKRYLQFLYFYWIYGIILSTIIFGKMHIWLSIGPQTIGHFLEKIMINASRQLPWSLSEQYLGHFFISFLIVLKHQVLYFLLLQAFHF